MASKITFEGSVDMNSAPEGNRSRIDMPKGSLQKRPVMIVCDLLDGAMEQLQQIFMAQTNPQVIQEDGRVRGMSRGSRDGPEESTSMNIIPEETTPGSDIQESSMEKRPVMILCDLPEGAMKKFQQIFMALKNPQVLGIEDFQTPLGKTPSKHCRVTPQEDLGVQRQRTRQGVRGMDMIPHEVTKKFQRCLKYHEINRLLEMVNKYPAQLFLHTMSTDFSKSILHVAVLESSPTLVSTVLEKLEEEGQSANRDLEMDPQDFKLKVDELGLSAAHMAALIGNQEILSHFGKIVECEMNIVDFILNDTNPFHTCEEKKMDLLEQASPLLDKQAPASIQHEFWQLTIREWLLKENIDFVYCLHETSRDCNDSHENTSKFINHVFHSGNSYFLVPLLNFRDKLGRSLLHGDTYEWMKNIISFLKRWAHHFPNLDFNMPDLNGRTPLHWASAQGFVELVTFLTNQDQTNLNATYGNLYEWKILKNEDFNVDDVGGVTPFHLAIIHNHVEVVEALLKVPKERGLNVNAICTRKVQFFDETSKHKYICEWTPFQLAAYMGHEKVLHVLLKDSRLYDLGLKNNEVKAPEQHNMIPALHLATSQFHPLVVEALVNSQRMNILINDKEDNTALHYATMHAHGQSQVHANLYGYVTISHFTTKPPKSRVPTDHDIITCMDILMHSVLNVERKNKNQVAPSLQSFCSENVKKWWLNNIAKKAEDLIPAANSVSITAALVATISFVGPLQPPLGLLDDENSTWLDGYSHVKYTSVKVFLFCNSLSFYFAIAAIVFSMLPSWPIPREWRAHEGHIARKCVQVAVFFLFGSIIFILCAFSAANIAIVPGERWRYKTIVVVPTSLGLLICLPILFLSFMRLLTLISPGNGVAKKISNFAIRTFLLV